MLHLINKSRVRDISVVDKELKTLIESSEDSLTSTVFGLLFYLPVELFWRILTDACYGDKLPKQSGRTIRYDFWPRWTFSDRNNTYLVEPDVFIQFEEFNLIIEAKHLDYNQQYHFQWKNQLKSYFNEFDDHKPVCFLAMGGITTGDEGASVVQIAGKQEVTVVKCRWKTLLAQVKKTQTQFKSIKHLTSANDAVLNILNDLIIAFRIHGYTPVELLETISKDVNIEYAPNSV
jgi:hypothetical protein